MAESGHVMRAARQPCPRGHGIFRGPCPRCLQLWDRERGSARARGYDTAWDHFSRAWLARFPVCGQRQDGRGYPDHSLCVRRGLRTPADVTDHIVALKDGGAHCDEANSQSLCTRCNLAKARCSCRYLVGAPMRRDPRCPTHGARPRERRSIHARP